MKSELLKQFRNLFQEKKVRFDRRLLIFFFFLMLSSFIWLLNILDKDYITEINFPVKYVNFPEKLVQTKDLPESFTLQVEASGYLLLRHKIGKTLYPLQIDVLEFLAEGKFTDSSGFNLRTSNFKNGIENQLHKQIKVIGIKPEVLQFNFTRKVTKEVNIYPVLKYTFDKQLIFKNKPEVIPSKVYVSGPGYIIDTLKAVYSIAKDLGKIDNDILSSISLSPLKNVVYSVNEAKLKIKVEKYTESSIQVPVQIINLPDSVSLQLNPENITINYCIGLSSFNTINPSQFTPIVDFKEIIENKVSKLTVLVKYSPPEVFNIKVSPRTIDYILKNKNL